VFVSYDHDDAKLCNDLVDGLQRSGFRVWTDHQLEVGRSFNESIVHAIHETRAVVLLSTNRSLTSEYVDLEVTWARTLRKCVCEVSLGGASHKDLKDIQHVEYTGEWSDVIHQLAPTIKRAIGPSKIFIAHDLTYIPKHCGECGGPIRTGANFCGDCGSKLTYSDAPVPANNAEKAFVDWVVSELRDHGLTCWYEPDEVGFWVNPGTEIDEAIDRSGVILAIVSTTSATSERFAQQTLRGMEQNDEILPIVFCPPGTSAKDLRASWLETVSAAVAGRALESRILQKLEEIRHIEPAVFADRGDTVRMTKVAKTLARRQDKFRIDEDLEEEVQTVFSKFMRLVREQKMDPVQVLNLPDFKVEAVDSEPQSGSTAGNTEADDATADERVLVESEMET
jgi:hypothetical protein